MRDVRLRAVMLGRLGKRQWGVPRHAYIGRSFRTSVDDGWTATCGLPKGRDRIRWERRDVRVVDSAADEWLPVSWREAMRRYCIRWPSSGVDVAPMSSLSEADRAKLVRDYARLVFAPGNEPDNFALGCGRVVGAYASLTPTYRGEGWRER